FHSRTKIHGGTEASSPSKEIIEMRQKTLYITTIVLIATFVLTMAMAAAQAPPAGGAGAQRGGGGAGGPGGGGGGQGRGGRGGGGPGLMLTSTSWSDGGEIPVKYAGAGQSISPALSWSNAPMGTVEFVLI